MFSAIRHSPVDFRLTIKSRPSCKGADYASAFKASTTVWPQVQAICVVVAVGLELCRRVEPVCPGCPPGFLPLFALKLLSFEGGFPKPSDEGGFELVELSDFKRASSSAILALRRMFSSRSSNIVAMASSSVMPLKEPCTSPERKKSRISSCPFNNERRSEELEQLLFLFPFHTSIP